MPGWYEKLKSELDRGDIQAIGLIQEQHPRRTELFNQWKELEMTMLVDPLNTLDVSAVPIVLLIDEVGVIRYRKPSLAQVKTFLSSDEPATETTSPRVAGSEWTAGDLAALQGQFNKAIAFYSSMLEANPDNARLNFRLGVVYRMKFDSPQGTAADFVTAVQHWKRALELDPNQYIWRRRIQQYGPILDKPYPFYNWVSRARAEIVARGDQPIRLRVEPQGAELAGPRSPLHVDAVTNESPDAGGKILRDDEGAIHVESTVVPATNPKQRALRVHMMLEPHPANGFAWNNEADPVRIWFDAPDGLELSTALVSLPLPPEATSRERRSADIEIRWDGAAPPKQLVGYVLYHVCEKDSGVCLYRRQDVKISLRP